MTINAITRKIKLSGEGCSFGNLGACQVDVVAGVGGNAEFPYDASRTITQSTKYYVSPTGSDSAAGTLAAPFATLSHALSLAGPGVAVLLLDGTHNWHAINAKFIGSSGSSGSPFLITSAPGHEPVVDCGGATSGYGLRIDNKSYWRVTHLKLTNYVTGIAIAEDVSCESLRFENLLGETNLGGDNVGLLKVVIGSQAPNLVISRVRTVNTGTGLHENTGGIWIKRTTDTAMTIDQVECIGGPIGLYFKHGNPTPTVQNMTVSNSAFIGQTRISMGHNPSGVVFTNCLFGDGAEVKLAEADGGEAGDLCTFDRCTFHDGITLTSQNQSVQPGAVDTKFVDCVLASLTVQSPSTVTTDSNYNVLSSISRYGSANTLAQWRTNNGSDANSVDGTIVYQGSDMTLIASYALHASSPGKGAASDAADMGCDVSTVGV